MLHVVLGANLLHTTAILHTVVVCSGIHTCTLILHHETSLYNAMTPLISSGSHHSDSASIDAIYLHFPMTQSAWGHLTVHISSCIGSRKILWLRMIEDTPIFDGNTPNIVLTDEEF